MGYEDDYSIEVGQLSNEENDDYLACCQVILANLKRQSSRHQQAGKYIMAVQQIADHHQRAI